jgi:hypothetical protein
LRQSTCSSTIPGGSSFVSLFMPHFGNMVSVGDRGSSRSAIELPQDQAQFESNRKSKSQLRAPQPHILADDTSPIITEAIRHSGFLVIREIRGEGPLTGSIDCVARRRLIPSQSCCGKWRLRVTWAQSSSPLALFARCPLPFLLRVLLDRAHLFVPCRIWRFLLRSSGSTTVFRF